MRGERLGLHVTIALAVVGAPLRMADDDGNRAGVLQHFRGDVAGVGAARAVRGSPGRRPGAWSPPLRGPAGQSASPAGRSWHPRPAQSPPAPGRRVRAAPRRVRRRARSSSSCQPPAAGSGKPPCSEPSRSFLALCLLWHGEEVKAGLRRRANGWDVAVPAGAETAAKLTSRLLDGVRSGALASAAPFSWGGPRQAASGGHCNDQHFLCAKADAIPGLSGGHPYHRQVHGMDRVPLRALHHSPDLRQCDRGFCPLRPQGADDLGPRCDDDVVRDPVHAGVAHWRS